MKILLHPAYFPNIVTFSLLTKHTVIWEVEDNYQKQSYRSRCYICTDQGKLMLNIPIKHVGGEQGRQKTKQVMLDNSYPWQRQHWRTLQTAYRTSPFFEYYEDDIAPLFQQPFQYLLEFNLKTIETVCDCLGMSVPLKKTSTYHKTLEEEFGKKEAVRDFRFLVNAKKQLDFKQQHYVQVFANRHGFVKNVSVLDLLFNEGPNSLAYLKEQDTISGDA